MIVSTKLTLIVLVILAISSAIMLIAIPMIYHPTYFLRAERFDQQPDTYFYLENPDAIVSQAISTPQKSVTINSLKDTQIDKLIDQHETSNVQVNDSFYQIKIGIADKFPPLFEFWISLFILPLSLVAIIIVLRKASLQKK